MVQTDGIVQTKAWMLPFLSVAGVIDHLQQKRENGDLLKGLFRATYEPTSLENMALLIQQWQDSKLTDGRAVNSVLFLVFTYPPLQAAGMASLLQVLGEDNLRNRLEWHINDPEAWTSIRANACLDILDAANTEAA